MLERVCFVDPAMGAHVEVYTDGYVFDPLCNTLRLISLVGNDSSVKAVSSALVTGKEVLVYCDDNSAMSLSAPREVKFRILASKLSCGAVHQIVADRRFFHQDDHGNHFLIIPPDGDVAGIIYQHVITSVASPVIPEWAEWITNRLTEQDHIRELGGTLKAVTVDVDESVIDEIVSEGVRTGQIKFYDSGGFPA